MDEKQPLWLPRGSVRAVIAISAFYGTMMMLLLGIPVPDWYVGLMGSIMAFYYTAREKA